MVPYAGDAIIKGIGEEAWQDLAHPSKQTPSASESMENV